MIQGPFAAQPGSATLDRTVMIVDEETNEPIDLTGMTVVAQMTPIGPWPNLWDNPGYLGTPTLIASTDTGEITIIDLGVVEILVAGSVIRAMNPGNYDVGITVKDPANDDYVAEVALGTLNILPGIVRAP